MNKKIAAIVVIILVIILGLYMFKNKEDSEIKVGWISDLTGPVAKYGAYEAGTLAMEEINAKGGINGKPLKIIFEDGKCSGKDAVSAMNKLVSIDKVKVVLGGHCSPESVAIAPIAEKNKVLMLASITGSPVLTNAGDYVFRTTPVVTMQSILISNLAYQKLGLKKFAVIYELTDYARPLAETFKDNFTKLGGLVPVYEGYNPGTTDFRTILEKARSNGVDGLIILPQSPDAGYQLMKQIKELRIKAKLFGNDVAGNQKVVNSEPALYEGLVLALPNFDVVNNPKSKAFSDAYNARFNTTVLPYGIYTAESYDAVYIIADGIAKYGYDVEKLKQYLYSINGYDGASGKITIDANGDGVRDYFLKTIKGGKIVNYDK